MDVGLAGVEHHRLRGQCQDTKIGVRHYRVVRYDVSRRYISPNIIMIIERHCGCARELRRLMLGLLLLPICTESTSSGV